MASENGPKNEEQKNSPEDELNSDLSDIYSTLRNDAKEIVSDLKGGVVMWREAAGGAAASTGFIIIFILSAFHYNPPSGVEGWAYVIGAGIVAVVLAVTSALGFRRYFQLSRKYKPLFERAARL